MPAERASEDQTSYHGADDRGRLVYEVPAYLVKLTRVLRRRSTSAEALLWECLRDRRLLGAKFRRQHAIGRYVADFYCHETRLVIELDGASHTRQRQREYDALRDRELQRQGLRVLRLKDEVVLESPTRALQTIAQVILEEGGRDSDPALP